MSWYSVSESVADLGGRGRLVLEPAADSKILYTLNHLQITANTIKIYDKKGLQKVCGKYRI